MLYVLELQEGFLPQNELICLLSFDQMSSHRIVFRRCFVPTAFIIYLQMACNTMWFYVENSKAKSEFL